MILFNLLELNHLFWIIGIILSLVLYGLSSKFFHLKWWEGLLVGLINLGVLAVGANLMYAIENIEEIMQYGYNFQSFSLFGAIFFLPLAIFINHLIFKKPNFYLGSFSIIPLVLMLGIYRFDCLKAGCCGGIDINGFIFPTQITEIIFCSILVIVFSIFTFYKKRVNGECYVWFYLSYGVFRFALEFLRERKFLFWNLSISHVWALLSIVLGIVLIIIQKRKVLDYEKEQ